LLPLIMHLAAVWSNTLEPNHALDFGILTLKIKS
jgi:hypothetical protein